MKPGLVLAVAFAAGSVLISSVLQLAQAQSLRPGWITDAKTGCQVWNPAPKPNETVTWSGACEGGFAAGHGIEQWFNDGKVGNRLEGDQHDGVFGGNVIVTYSSGSRYVGELKDGQRDGQGTYSSASGDKYVGEFKGDHRDGQGTYTYASGDKYVGGYKDDQKDGEGTAYSKMGTIIGSGLWAHGILLVTEIPLVQDRGVLKVPVVINGTLALNFVIDSGASDVSLPADVVLVMMRTGKLSETDFLGRNIYTLADGSKVPSTTFRIRSLKVGGRILTNVVGSMTDQKGELLLGQSFLSRFKRWSINNGKQVLELE